MNKLVPVIVLLVVATGLWFAISSREPTPTSGGKDARVTTGTQDAAPDSVARASGAPRDGGSGADDDMGFDGEDDMENFDERSAVERYKTADEALKAVREGSTNYDDLVLDQFAELGENCSWCPTFYQSVRDMMLSPETKPEQKSYFAEVLAISGRVENVQALVEAIKNSPNEEDARVYAEALELTVGKNDVVNYLNEQLSSPNETLREASVAAITNQGSRRAVEVLSEHTASRGDPDGYYALGIGLGEVVPDPEAYPLLQEKLLQRDQYSHLAAKALLNTGLDGLKIVMDSLATSSNPAADRELLKGAKDHVTFDDDVIAYLKQVAETSKNPSVREFAQESLKDFEQMEAEAAQDEEEDLDEPFTPLNP